MNLDDILAAPVPLGDFVRDPKKAILIRDQKSGDWKFAEASRQDRRWDFEELSEESFWTHLKELIAD